MSRVSVILPVYNGEDNIEESIKSVMNQTYIDIELIIVDDCSTDMTPFIIQKWAEEDERIKIIRNKDNLRLPASLNVGFQNATGEFLTWTSDDNFYKENAIEIMVDFLENKLECGLVYCNTILVDQTGKLIKKNPLPEPENLIYANTVGACFLYRNSVAKLIGEYDVNLFLAEDYDYWMRIYQNAQICHIQEELYFYRCHEKSLSFTRLQEVKIQTAKVWEKHFNFIVDKSKNKKRKELYSFWDLFLEYCTEEKRYEIRKRIEKETPFYICYLLMKKCSRYR